MTFEDGICLFPQGATLTLEKIRPLIEALIEHGCENCGSVPIHYVDRGSNNTHRGILAANCVSKVSCTSNCSRGNGIVAGLVTQKIQRPYSLEVLQSWSFSFECFIFQQVSRTALVAKAIDIEKRMNKRGKNRFEK